jgi:predicted RND superfamily exporter protein
VTSPAVLGWTAQAVGAPVAVSGGAVALAFGVLAVSRLAVLRQFGLVAAVELLLCAVAAIAMVPPLCAALDGRRARTVVSTRRRVSLTREEPVRS